jgi:NAD(P)-dependent dehydrogenase (short-subunit alcohol dehydrogenase family)
MVERGWGRVVHVASVAGLSGARYISAYAASKHAVVGFTRSVAAEVAPSGVTVNSVCPGYVDTTMTRESVARIAAKTGRSEAEALAAVLAANPQGRLIEPEEVARAVTWLCEEETRGVNGRAIVIDGGALGGAA